MADVGNRERLLLYWLSDYTAEGIGLLGLDELDDIPYRHRLERDCLIADERYPPTGAVDAFQVLLDGGSLIAWTEDDRGKPRQLTQVDENTDFEFVEFELTEDGDREARAFLDLLESEAGRRVSARFAREFAARETASLPFTAVVPEYLPRQFDPVPDVISYSEEGGVTLRYYETARSGDDQIFVDETVEELGEDDEDYDSEVITQDKIAGVAVTVRELQLTSQWVEVRIDWEKDGVSYRLSYHRSEGQALDEDLPGDVGESSADIQADTSNAGPRIAEIDEGMRRESRRVVESIIAAT